MKTDTRLISKICLFCLLFIFIFGWKITSSIDLILISSLLIFVVFYIKYGVFKLRKNETRILLGLLIMLLYGFLIYIIRGAFDSTFLTRSVRTLVNTVAAFFLGKIYYDFEDKKTFKLLLKHMEYCIVLHALLCVIMYISTSFANTIYEITNIVEWGASSSITLGFRTPGLTYALSQTSVVQMWGILLIMYNHSKNKENTIFCLFKCLVVVASVFVVGRTGLLLGIISIPVYFLILNIKSIGKAIKIVFFVALIIGVLALAWDKISLLIPNKFFLYNINHAEEVFDFLAGDGSGTVETITDSMFFLPENGFDLLFGTSSLGRSNEVYISSDVGYVKVIFAVGLFGSIIVYTPTIMGMYYTLKNKSDSALKWLTLLIVMTNLVLNLKELAIYTRNQWSIIALLIYACMIPEKKIITESINNCLRRDVKLCYLQK